MAADDRQVGADQQHLTEPLQFTSYLRPQVWGGNSLIELLGKTATSKAPIGESWEICGLSDHPSLVSNGPIAGQSLSDLWRDHVQDLAGFVHESPTFPLFIKWLDCRELLSVQVHPNDAMAREVLGQPCGKSEAWVVVHAEPTARVYAGLRAGVTPEELRAKLEAGSVAECLHSFVPKVGDCISLPAGTVHSAGGGVVFAEVQQPSDTTFRLFDWNRMGMDGNPRSLHVEMAMKSITWPQKPVSPVDPRPLDCIGVYGETLLQTPAFDMERYIVCDRFSQPHSGEMTIWMVMEGVARLSSAGGAPDQILETGSTVLIPAAATGVTWSAVNTNKHCQLLCVRLPSAVE